jgi:hypothetical protein
MPRKPQIQKFRDLARKSGSDESAEAFDATLKRIARKPSDQTKHPAELKGLVGKAHKGG